MFPIITLGRITGPWPLWMGQQAGSLLLAIGCIAALRATGLRAPALLFSHRKPRFAISLNHANVAPILAGDRASPHLCAPLVSENAGYPLYRISFCTRSM